MSLTRLPITSLPNELLMEVAKNLDAFTQKNLIEAYPHLANLLIPSFETTLFRACYNPICWAAMYGYGDLARILLENGADMYATDNGELTAFHWAVSRGMTSLIELFLDHGFQIDWRDGRYQKTGLHYAVEYGRVNLAKYLVQKGADITLRCQGGRTVTHLAVSYHKNASKILPILEFLLGLKVDLCARDNSGKKAAYYLVREFGKSSDLVRFLLEYGVEACFKSGQGDIDVLLERVNARVRGKKTGL